MNSTKQVNWFEIATSKPNETATFYSKVFGHTCETPDDGSHTVYDVSSGNECVMSICDEAVLPKEVKGWIPHIAVEDYDYSLSQIATAGGKICEEKVVDIDFMGQRNCLAIDPSGSAVMLCESEVIKTKPNQLANKSCYTTSYPREVL